MDSIRNHPVTGVGLGNAYRGLTAREAETRYTRFVRFIESSYLYVATKMGLPGLAILIWFVLASVLGGWRNYRAAADPVLKGLSLACVASLAGVLVWAFVHPLLMLPEYTINIGLIIGLSEAVGLLTRGEVA
jgi:O-antigen ligase